MNINSMGRRIRTRLYFTSESHLHTVLNTFRFAQTGESKKSLLSHHGKSILNSTPELCYLTQVVMRVFEDNRRPVEDPRRFRMEILFSPGATATPMHMNELDREQDQSRFDTAPLQLIGREGLTCQEVEEFFEQAIMAGRSDEESYEIASTSTAAERVKKPKKKKPKNEESALVEDSVKTDKSLPPPEFTPPEPAEVVKEASEEVMLPPPAIVETSSPAVVEDLSVAPDIPPPEPPVGETSLLSEATDHSIGHPDFSALDTVRAKNDSSQQKQRASIKDIFPDSVVVRATNELAKENGDINKIEEETVPSNAESGQEGALGRDAKEPQHDDREPNRTFSRKYFWGTVAIASFGVGITCITMALTMSQGARRSRRWSSRSY